MLEPAREKEAVSREQDDARLAPPSSEEIARRKALVAEILDLRNQAMIAPLTSADLVHHGREQAYEAYGKPR